MRINHVWIFIGISQERRRYNRGRRWGSENRWRLTCLQEALLRHPFLHKRRKSLGAHVAVCIGLMWRAGVLSLAEGEEVLKMWGEWNRFKYSGECQRANCWNSLCNTDGLAELGDHEIIMTPVLYSYIVFKCLDPAARKLKIRQTTGFIQVGMRGLRVTEMVNGDQRSKVEKQKNQKVEGGVY